jgi:hypothetical protein
MNTVDISIYLQEDILLSQFHNSCQKELISLLKKGIFKVVKLVDVPNGIILFNSRFVDEIKNPRTDLAFEKLRLVV